MKRMKRPLAQTPLPSNTSSTRISIARATLYGISLVLYLISLSSTAGIIAALAFAVFGIKIATIVHRLQVRKSIAIAGSILALFPSIQLDDWLLNSQWIAEQLTIQQSFALAQVLTFGFTAFFIVFLLRFLAQVSRVFSLLEVIFVAGSVTLILADHRHRMLNRPRIFSDLAWAHGIDPGILLLAIGILSSLAAIFLFLRHQPITKFISTLLFLLLLGGAFFLIKDKRLDNQAPLDALGLSGNRPTQQQKSNSQSPSSPTGGGAGANRGNASNLLDNPFKDNYTTSGQPSPVAIAILHDDFRPPNDVVYFRQMALSSYNGHHLVGGQAQGWDTDIITEFPRANIERAHSLQNPVEHLVIPTTMYLLVEHPQPVALTHAFLLQPVTNPNPQQFVAAYDVQSRVLAIPPQRLLGRRSIPKDWSKEMQDHYLALPEDPRYGALADIIGREVDPRFANDDLAHAYAIKRYLEREGFYTMQSQHSSSSDPTASFLFGSLRGYCVHFAHAAVYLMRSQGIAARVALGYAVQVNKRSGGSSILIMSDRAHAWPEIHLEGIGWVTFDIYPERTDIPPPSMVDYDLEKLLGELARNDKTAGLAPDQRSLIIPWRQILQSILWFILGLLMITYVIKFHRRFMARWLSRRNQYPRAAYLAVLDRFSDLGRARRPGETRECHAARISHISPHFQELTQAHLAWALGAKEQQKNEWIRLQRLVLADWKKSISLPKRILALLNPIGWFWTR